MYWFLKCELIWVRTLRGKVHSGELEHTSSEGSQHDAATHLTETSRAAFKFAMTCSMSLAWTSAVADACAETSVVMFETTDLTLREYLQYTTAAAWMSTSTLSLRSAVTREMELVSQVGFIISWWRASRAT